jgi:acyl-CoA dehydrogenase
MTIAAETSTLTTHRNVHTTDALQAIYDHTVDFVANEVVPNGSAWEEAGMVPREVLRQMGSLGMFGLRVPEELGGLGLGMLASATFAEALGTSTYGGFEATVLVHTDMALPHLLNSGTPEQLERWLPPVLAGETILAIGVTEPDAGSDVAGLRTTAVRDGEGWRINGRKTFITNAVYGDLVIVAARTDANERYGISMFLVPTDTPGFAVASKLNKHGWLCSDTAELTLDDVWVDNHQLLGTEHRGFHETMRNFQDERMVLIGMAVGASQTALDLTTAYCSERKGFDVPRRMDGRLRSGQRPCHVRFEGIRSRGGQPGHVRLPAVPRRHGLHARVHDRANDQGRPDPAHRRRCHRGAPRRGGKTQLQLNPGPEPGYLIDSDRTSA